MLLNWHGINLGKVTWNCLSVTVVTVPRCQSSLIILQYAPTVKETSSISRNFSHHANSLVHVTVTEDDKRRLPAQLQRNLLQVTDSTAVTGNFSGKMGMKLFHLAYMSPWATGLSGQTVPLHDLFANRCGASEAQLADVWVVRQTLSHHATCTGERDQ